MIQDPTIRSRSSRRGFLAVAAASVILGLAACGGEEAEGRPAEAESPEETVTSDRLFGAGVTAEPERPEAPAEAPERGPASLAPADPEGPAPAPRPAPRQESDGPLDVTDLGFNHGSPDAPIKVIEFSDFGCGYCRKFHQETFPALEEEYIETGKVIWKYIPFVIGMFPNAIEAATAGECAGEQGHFAIIRDRLFDDQAEWRKSSTPYEVFERYAREEGLEVNRFETCIEEGWQDERVRKNVEAGRHVGVRGTPTFVVEGFPLQGALPLPVFRDIFQRLLSQDSAEGS